jgi:hypothetical protein
MQPLCRSPLQLFSKLQKLHFCQTNTTNEQVSRTGQPIPGELRSLSAKNFVEHDSTGCAGLAITTLTLALC